MFADSLFAGVIALFAIAALVMVGLTNHPPFRA
jgi:hypothetical protein